MHGSLPLATTALCSLRMALSLEVAAEELGSHLKDLFGRFLRRIEETEIATDYLIPTQFDTNLLPRGV